MNETGSEFVIRKLSGETLVLDQHTNRVHCLSPAQSAGFDSTPESSRRAFLTRAGLVGVGTVGATVLAPLAQAAATGTANPAFGVLVSPGRYLLSVTSAGGGGSGSTVGGDGGTMTAMATSMVPGIFHLYVGKGGGGPDSGLGGTVSSTTGTLSLPSGGKAGGSGWGGGGGLSAVSFAATSDGVEHLIMIVGGAGGAGQTVYPVDDDQIPVASNAGTYTTNTPPSVGTDGQQSDQGGGGSGAPGGGTAAEDSVGMPGGNSYSTTVVNCTLSSVTAASHEHDLGGPGTGGDGASGTGSLSLAS